MNRLPADAFAVAAPPSRETAPIVTALKTSSMWRHVVMNPLCALAFLFGFAPASQAAVSVLGAPAQVAANTSLAFTVPAGTNRLLVVTASNASSTAVPTVSFGVTPMTLVVQRDDTFATDSIWRLALGTSVTPTTATITVSGFTTAANTVVTAQTFDGVDQTTPIDGTGTQQISSGSDIASSITLNTTTAGDLVFDIFDSFRNSGPITATPNAPQTGIHDVSLTIALPGTGIGRYRTSSKTGVTGSTTVGWTSDSVAILHLAANINAAAVLPNPNLSINDVAINEGNVGSTAFTFNVNLSAPAGPGGVVFDIATANNTATAGVDYVANALTAQTIPAGSSTYAFTVQVNGDTTFEPNEIFFVNVTNVVGATVVDGQGMGTITNDDADPCAPFMFPYTLAGNTPAELIQAINCANANGASADTINLGAQTVTLTAILASVAGMNTGLPEITTPMTIQNGTITRSSVDPFRFFVNNSTLNLNNLTVTNGDSQGDGGALLNGPSSALNITNSRLIGNSGNFGGAIFNSSNGTTTVTNSLVGGNRGNSQGGGIRNRGTLILNNSTVAGNFTTTGVDGGGGIANAGTFSLTLNNSIVFGNEASNFPATNEIVGAFTSNNSLVGVNPSFVAPLDASATAPTIGGDYRLGNLGVAVDAGDNSLVPGAITVDLDGNPRRFNDTGVADTGAGTAPIVDVGAYEKQTNSAALPVLSISDVSIAEGNSGTSILAFTVTRSGASASVVGFDFATADGTATVASGDYVAASGSGSIAAGGATGSTQVSVTINGDGVFENTETFFVNLSLPTNATIGDGQGIGTLTNDDLAPTLAINNVSIAEGNSGTSSLVFTVTRNGLTAFPATFTALATDGTAGAPSDYSATLAGTTSIAAGGVTATTTLTATINGDAVVEANETFSVVLSAPTNASIAAGTGTGTIINDDIAGVVITQSSGSTDVTEGGATDTYTLLLTSQPTNNVSITLTPNTQVTAATSPVVFTPGNWNIAQTVTVTAIDDNVVEGVHTGSITHAVTSADAGYNNLGIAGLPNIGITDNDTATVQFSSASVSQLESANPMAFSVTLSNPVASGLTLTVASTNGTAGASDFTAITGGMVTFAANTTTSQTVNVTINNDALDEDDEAFTLTLSNPVATGSVTLGTASATGTIQDEDALPVLSVANVSQPEGNASNVLNVIVSLTPASGRAVGFTRATADGSASSVGPDADFVALAAGSVTIPAGQTSVTIPVTVNGDTVFEGDENFSLNVTGVNNATPGNLTASATLQDDDQQSTTTEITSDNPDPSGVDAPYTVQVTIRGQTLSPAGTVTVNDGTGASCGPVTIVAGTPPASSASCVITSTTPGIKTLTATYVPGSTAFAASSDTELHTVNLVAPTVGYAPTPGSSVVFTGVTTIGTTGTGTIIATPSGGAGNGAGATTTLNGCTLGGANPGSFAGAAAIDLIFIGSTTAPQNLSLTCTSQPTAQSATLTCNETSGTAAAVSRQWSLSCPSGPLLPLTSVPTNGATVNVTGVSGGGTTTAQITVTNPNPVPVSLTCTAPAIPFTATPLAFTIPAGGAAPIAIGISPGGAGSYTGTLNCAIAGSSQVLTFNLGGILVPATAVDALAPWSRWMLILLMLCGGLALGYMRRH